jgi:hypothetical protein
MWQHADDCADDCEDAWASPRHEKRDELAPLHRIASSALTRSVIGRPRLGHLQVDHQFEIFALVARLAAEPVWRPSKILSANSGRAAGQVGLAPVGDLGSFLNELPFLRVSPTSLLLE